MSVLTSQTNAKEHDKKEMLNYGFFLGGVNATNQALQQYDPFKTGFGRLFMIRKPAFIEDLGVSDTALKDKLNKFKHILEYANTAVSGIGDVSVDFASMAGGYSGRSLELPTGAKDSTDTFTVSTFEFSGSPVREMLHLWINSVLDLQSGLSHYAGSELEVSQANHTAEFIYVVTDQSGKKIEYACHFANCFPRGLKNDHFNYTSGQHDIVEYAVDFSCTKYESPQINRVAKVLLEKYGILMNSLNFHCGFTYDEANGLNKITYSGNTMVNGESGDGRLYIGNELQAAVL